jgi:uracil-DNA glycosylase
VTRLTDSLDSSWERILAPYGIVIAEIAKRISTEETFPAPEKVFRALALPRNDVKVVILGQDPYPTPGTAEGLAFSVPPEATRLPPSLRNIFREYSDDLSLPTPSNGHLIEWVNSGALLLNRILTVRAGAPLSHQGIGWETITDALLRELAGADIPIICWGVSAKSAAIKNGFSGASIISSPHPSPLSAYRGFFGSKPFTRSNSYLADQGKSPMDWNLS